MYLHSISGPQLTAGKYGNAVYTPNTQGSNDDNVISLGTHDNDCFGNVGLCTNGATLSFWIKGVRPRYLWPRLLDGSWFEFWFELRNNELLVSAAMKNGTHYHQFIFFAKMTYDQWHNIGMTFSPGSKPEVYFDGCKTEAVENRISAGMPILRTIELGCFRGATCVEIHYDDLRFWTATKSPQFMWWLWNQL